MHHVKSQHARFAILLVCGALAATTCSVTSAQEMALQKRPVSLEFVSTLPEAITYYDEGFSDFIRDSKEVALTSISVNELTTQSIKKSIQAMNIEIAPSGKALRPLSQEEADLIVAGFAQRSDVDALVVIRPGSMSSERFIKGMAVMTKIGLIGITKLSMIFTMPNVAIYSRGSSKPCVRLNLVRTKRIPAIYKSWSEDMKNGPSESMHRDMQALIAGELPLTLEEGIAENAHKIAMCLAPTVE